MTFANPICFGRCPHRFLYPPTLVALKGLALTVFIFGLHFPLSAQTPLIINEAMASNRQTLTDEDGDHADWIELRYTGADTLDLSDYGLSDHPADPFKWRFPSVKLAPGSYLLVWASGKDRRDPGAPLHTNYSISAAGETLLLTRPDGLLLDSLPAVVLRPDISFGRTEAGKNDLRYFLESTPGSPNITHPYLGILAEPRLALSALEAGGGFQLVCSHPDSSATIRFRLDGGVPRELGEEYQDTLILSDIPPARLMHIPTNPWEAHVGGFGWLPPEGEFPAGIVVRARAYRPNYIPSLPVTVTHLDFTSELPLVMLSMDSMDLFSDSIGIYVPGRFFSEFGWNWDVPSGGNANYFQSGPEWERPAHIAVRLPDGSHHEQYIGVRMHGGGTRALPQKSLRLYARGGYGLDHFPLDFFKDGRTNHRRVILRNSGQDAVFRSTMLRDAVIHRVLAPLRVETQSAHPALLLLNGEYWGIHNFRERYDDDYLSLAYGIPPQELDLLENNLVPEAGDYLHYHELMLYLQAQDPADDAVYEEVTRRLDPDSYMDAQIAHIYSANYDWPGNNVLYWRKRTDQYQPQAPYGHDGRWRWMFKDADMGFGLWDGQGYDLNMLVQATAENGPAWPNPDWSTFLFRKMLRNVSFRDGFITRYCDLLNTALLPHRVLGLLDQSATQIEPHMEMHIRRWGRPGDMDEWRTNLEGMRAFALNRPWFQRQQLREFFDLADPLTVTLQVTDPTHGHIRINTVAIHASTAGVREQPWPWIGAYFQGLPLALEAIPAPGFRFSHWSGSYIGDEPRLVMIPELQALAFTAHFEADGTLPGGHPIHYWHFNTLPSGNITSVPADLSLPDGGLITYPGSGTGYLDRVNEGSVLNALEDIPAGRALRVRNPSDSRELLLQLPTTGYRPLALSYGVTRTNNGATRQSLWYSLSQDPEWHALATDLSIHDTFRLININLEGIPDAADNPWFAIRVLFEGPAASGVEGNNRFDNILITGDPISHTDPTPAWLQDVSLVPNPAHVEARLFVTLLSEQSVNLTVYDALGNTMTRTGALHLAAGEHHIPISVMDWPAGIYYCHLASDRHSPLVISMMVVR